VPRLAASRWQAEVCAPQPAANPATRYARHAPERTLLYALVEAHYQRVGCQNFVTGLRENVCRPRRRMDMAALVGAAFQRAHRRGSDGHDPPPASAAFSFSAVSGVTRRHSSCSRFSSKCLSSSGLNVPSPTCWRTCSQRVPACATSSNRRDVKCRPAVGAATLAASSPAKQVWGEWHLLKPELPRLVIPAKAGIQ